MWLLVPCGLLVATALYLFFKETYSRFSQYGVKGPSPVPFLGNMTNVVLKRKHFIDHLDTIYSSYPEEKFFGMYEFLRPVVLIRDLELLKKITIKDFDHFTDHRTTADEQTDPYFGKNLFSLKGQVWRDMRSTLSPAFTSSKIRAMVPFMMEVGDQMISILRKKIGESESDYIDVDIKDLSTRYANDVIATCAFGLKVDSHAEENNEFYRMGKEASNFGLGTFVKMFGFAYFPTLMKKLNMSLFSNKVKVFFKDLMLQTIKERENKHIIRPDMIHLLMEAKKGKLTYDTYEVKDADAGFATVDESSVGKKEITRKWDDMDLIAQALGFFIAGFETVASVMAFLLLEVAINHDVQERLYQEIKETNEKNSGKLDYNSLQSMTYLDMVVSELLRLWPPGFFTDRMCVQDYNLGKANEQAADYILRKGECIGIPSWGIQHNPDYYPNPLKFDPERFSAENVHNIKPFTYLPFGLGPRNCIGSRFALCEVKVMAYQLLLNFEISPGEKLHLPLQMSMESMNLSAKGGHWVQVRARKYKTNQD